MMNLLTIQSEPPLIIRKLIYLFSEKILNSIKDPEFMSIRDYPQTNDKTPL